MILGLIEYYFKSNIISIISSHIMLRSFFTLLSAWLIFLLIGPYSIFLLKKFKIYQVIRDHGPPSHMIKQHIPTMGGIVILFSIISSILLWANLSNRYVWYVIFILISYGCIGFVDDYLKVFKKNSFGLSILLKYCLLSVIALLFMFLIYLLEGGIIGTQLVMPYFSTILPLWVWYIFLGYLVIVGTSNAVNLSDGLDGLAVISVVSVAAGLGIISLISSNIYFSNYFHVPYFVFFKELVIICSALIGAGLGFLWFNTYPAQIFMGDIGSLSLGGAIGVIAVLLRQEFMLFIMGGVFVLEVISVIIQVFFFRIFGCRVFRMTPFHHHFELQGFPESRIVIRLWIVTLILILTGLVIFRYINYG